MKTTHGNDAWKALSDAPGKLAGQDVRESRAPAENVVLGRAGFESADRVKALLDKSAEAALAKWRPAMLELDPDQVPFVAARSAPKGCYGRGGTPRHVLEMMQRDYQRLGSLEKVGKLYHRSRQSMYQVFTRAGLPLNRPNFHARILFGGLAYTPGKGGYYRATTGDRTRMLHHEIWKAGSGREIPEGWEVAFRNADNADLRFCNLVCLPAAEVRRLNYERKFPERRALTPEQRAEFWRKHNRDYMRERTARNIAQGLRGDGQPRRKAA